MGLAYSSLTMIKKLESIIGEQVFVKLMLQSAEKSKGNALEQAIYKKKASIVEYFVSFQEIKKEYEFNKKLMAKCVYNMAEHYDESVVNVILSAFNWNEK